MKIHFGVVRVGAFQDGSLDTHWHGIPFFSEEVAENECALCEPTPLSLGAEALVAFAGAKPGAGTTLFNPRDSSTCVRSNAERNFIPAARLSPLSLLETQGVS